MEPYREVRAIYPKAMPVILTDLRRNLKDAA